MPANATTNSNNYCHYHVLDFLLNSGFFKVTAAHFGAQLISVTRVQLQQLVHVKFGELENLHLANEHILQRVNTVAGFFNFTTNGFWNKLLYQFLQVTGRCLLGNDIEDLLANLTYLRTLRVCGFLNLVGTTPSERNNKETEQIPISGFDVDISLNECLPFFSLKTATYQW